MIADGPDSAKVNCKVTPCWNCGHEGEAYNILYAAGRHRDSATGELLKVQEERAVMAAVKGQNAALQAQLKQAMVSFHSQFTDEAI